MVKVSKLPVNRIRKKITSIIQLLILRVPVSRRLSHWLNWRIGITHELRYWDHSLREDKTNMPDHFAERLDPNTPLQENLKAFIDAPAGAKLKCLAVGAGPITRLGKIWPERQLDIIAIDPLAKYYDQLLQKHDIVPPVRTIPGYAERLTKQFGTDYFDFVHARNCLDHSYNPVAAIEQIISVVKPGGYVYLHHKINEGLNASYNGLHQWNFFHRDGDFYVGGRIKEVNITEQIEEKVSVRFEVNENNALMVYIKKK